jgi:Holliday junction resolvase RusA-like endonuclease
MLQRRSNRKYSEFQKLKKDSQNKRPVDADNRSSQAEENEGTDRQTQSVILGVFGFSNRRCRDIDGTLATLFDCLIRAGILKDDSLDFIQAESFTGIRGKRDFVEIIIIERENEDS